MIRIGLLSLLVLNVFCGLAQQKITLEDIWTNGKYRTKGVYGIRSMNSGEYYTSLKSGNIIRYEYRTGDEVDTVVVGSELYVDGHRLSIYDYAFNATETKLLLAADAERLYRYSVRCRYFVFDLSSKQLTAIANGKKVYHATFSPVANQVAYVFENDLFIQDLDAQQTIRVTDNGKLNEIINGMSDWVYEEEFGFTKAFQWSPDGRFLAYYEFDEKEVKEFSMPMYQGRLYPEEYRFKYPKAGEANSKVTVHLYDLTQNRSVKVNMGMMDDMYIPRIKWTKDPSILSLQRMNRLQNELELLFADALTGKTRTVLKETSDTYIEINDNLVFLDGQQFIWSSEKDGYNHLYLYDVNGNEVVQLTSGQWDVTEFYGVGYRGKQFYYQSSEEGPTQRHVYAAALNGTFKRRLTPAKGQNYAHFSTDMSYFINEHSDANTPPFISLMNNKGKQLRVLEDNAQLKQSLEQVQPPQKEFFSFTPSHGTPLNGWMIKPNDFDGSRQYPVVVMVYGGPGSNTVHDAWSTYWGTGRHMWQVMLGQQGYVVVSVDNRGTGNRGREFKNCTYRELGKLETEDLIETAKYLGSLNYVDASRIGIFGWSYGGYLSSLAITKGAEYFSAAIAVAPVTNWRFYDTVYTERYMRTPQENPVGYDENSPINHVDKLKGAYLLVHGTADDNVHFQNSVEMTEALIEANKHFEFYMYPDRNHGIYGNNASLHLFTKLTDFLKKNL